MPPEADRGAARFKRALVRTATFSAWCFVLWGSLVALATLWTLSTGGVRAAADGFARLSALSQWLAGLALVVWGLAAWALLDARARRRA